MDHNLERGFSPESDRNLSRSEVVAAYNLLAKQGFLNPDDPSLDNAVGVQEASSLYARWYAKEYGLANRDPEKLALLRIDKFVLLIDAGFIDPEYVNKVINEINVVSGENISNENIQRRVNEVMERISSPLVVSQ